MNPGDLAIITNAQHVLSQGSSTPIHSGCIVLVLYSQSRPFDPYSRVLPPDSTPIWIPSSALTPA